MSNIKKSTTLMLSTALVGKSKTAYDTKNASKAILNAIEDFHILPPTEQKISSFGWHNVIPDPEDRRNVKNFPIRIPLETFGIIKEFLVDNNVSKTVTMMIGKVLYVKSRQTDATDKLLYVWGNKWDNQMQDAISNIKATAENISWNTSVETCAGGLGIYANFKFADNEIVNDADWLKMNLYRAIQLNPHELIIRTGSLKVNQQIFDEQKKIIKEAKKTSEVDYEVATAHLYLNLNSFMNEGCTMSNEASDARYCKALWAIRPLHQRLNQCTIPNKADTTLSNLDILEIIEKYRKRTGVLFIIDPPYLDADLYNNKDNKFGEKKHQHLAKLLQLVKYSNGNDFIYFCRITAPKKYQSEPNAAAYDNHMKCCIDDLYYGHGFYYTDVVLNGTTTERIITSFDFDGAIPYGCERGQK